MNKISSGPAKRERAIYEAFREAAGKQLRFAEIKVLLEASPDSSCFSCSDKEVQRSLASLVRQNRLRRVGHRPFYRWCLL